MVVSWLAPLLFGCGDKQDPGVTQGTTRPQPTVTVGTGPYIGGFNEGQFCDVQAVFQVSCVVGCHSGLVPGGGLDLEADPYAATVGVAGSNGQPYVDPGYPDRSLLYQRMSGAPYMPPSGKLDQIFLDVVYAWIANGAVDDCDPTFVEPTGTTTDYTEADPYHPPGWSDAGAHGLAANLQTDGDCRSCHGAQLDGGTAGVSCDSCHVAGWRTDCTYCHGGVENLTGAPPEDIDNSQVSQAFPAHTEHVAGPYHPAYGCSECHQPRTDVLTPGHVFDDLTAGYGEVYYGNGLSKYGTYLFGTCTNLYCHGSGLADDGEASVGDTMYCYSCHPDAEYSQAADWNTMSGRHRNHLDSDIPCSECHSVTADANQNIIGPQYHVDGEIDVLPVGTTWNGQSCNGSCHNHNHNDSDW